MSRVHLGMKRPVRQFEKHYAKLLELIKEIEKYPATSELEKTLYNYMYKASRDGILESREFEKWCKNNYKKILDWFGKVLDYESEILNEEKADTYTASVQKTRTEKTYDEMTTEEKLAYLQQEKEKLINQATPQVENPFTLNKRRN